jgi:hypothetical protein
VHNIVLLFRYEDSTISPFESSATFGEFDASGLPAVTGTEEHMYEDAHDGGAHQDQTAYLETGYVDDTAGLYYPDTTESSDLVFGHEVDQEGYDGGAQGEWPDAASGSGAGGFEDSSGVYFGNSDEGGANDEDGGTEMFLNEATGEMCGFVLYINDIEKAHLSFSLQSISPPTPHPLPTSIRWLSV